MKHIKTIMQSPSIKRRIMLRIYLSYSLSILSNAAFWQAFMLVTSGALLAKWLHVASIIDNFFSVPVREVPNFIWHSFAGAISHGELLTVIVFFVALGVTFLSARRLSEALVSPTFSTR